MKRLYFHEKALDDLGTAAALLWTFKQPVPGGVNAGLGKKLDQIADFVTTAERRGQDYCDLGDEDAKLLQQWIAAFPWRVWNDQSRALSAEVEAMKAPSENGIEKSDDAEARVGK